MKKIILLLCIFSIVFNCSCGLLNDPKYVCDVASVELIQIVRLEKYIETEYRFEYTILSQISNNEAFVHRLNELEHSVNWGDPNQLDIQDVVIKIDYSNGDFDLIHPDAQCFNRSGKNQYGYFFFNDEQFNSLIDDYINSGDAEKILREPF